MQIPKNAKLAFKGIIFDVYQWEQKLFDDSFATFEALKRPGTVQVIPVTGDQIFLSFEEQPTKPRCYSLLGGRQEEGEEPEATAKRELLEETGMESDDWQLFKSYEFGAKFDWTNYLFIARNCRKITEPKLDPGEKIQVREVSFDEFMEVSTQEDFWANPQIIADFLRMKLDPKKLAEFKQKLFFKNKPTPGVE